MERALRLLGVLRHSGHAPARLEVGSATYLLVGADLRRVADGTTVQVEAVLLPPTDAEGAPQRLLARSITAVGPPAAAND